VEFLLVLVVLLVVVALLARPLRAPAEPDDDRAADLARADLEAARDAKYAEIREAELDFRLGKLSPEDWRALDGRLRGEAVEILRELDAVG
jgi:hypothetical protein